jgi:hypothetical protein
MDLDAPMPQAAAVMPDDDDDDDDTEEDFGDEGNGDEANAQ